MSDLDPAPVLAALQRHPTLRVFTRDGVVETLPARLFRRRALLNHIALAFEPGERYPEPQLDQFLRRIHADHATLRRYLVDEGFLDRDRGVYWRTGGSADAAAWS
jgi:hypothetical protein